MLIGRMRTADGVVHVRADGERAVPIENPYDAHAQGRKPADVGAPVSGDLLAPSAPVVVVGIAQNGPDHPSPVQAWLKSPRTVVESGTPVTLGPGDVVMTGAPFTARDIAPGQTMRIRVGNVELCTPFE